MFITTATTRDASRANNPRDPYPLIWSPRFYGVSLACVGLGGA